MSTKVFFIEHSSPAQPDKAEVDYSVAYASTKAALEHARKSAGAKYGQKAVVKTMGDNVNVFLEVDKGVLALLASLKVKSIPIQK